MGGSGGPTSISGSNSGNARVGEQTAASASSISIPSIGLNHGITAGGLNGGVLSPNPGEIEQFVGYGRVAPGKNGISVIAGHVTYNGPDVFYRLGDVPVGGKVTITFANGSNEDFVVTNKASINKDALTNDARVWGSSSSPVLVLVTCDSSSAWANAQHHVNNLVVWARPA